MTFLAWPLAAAVAAVAIPALIILYLLKLRRRDLEISTTLLWKKAVQDLQANAPLQKLRRNIMLLLQLLVLAALLFALAEPVMKSGTFKGQRHVILLDRSASMATLDSALNTSAPTPRLEQMKKEALSLVDSLREPGLFAKATNATGDEAMIIAFDNAADVRQSFTSDKQKLRAAIEGITQSDAPTSLGEAMRLAKAHAPKRIHVDNDGSTQVIEGLSGGPEIAIHLFSDGRIPDADQAKPAADDSFEFHSIGSVKSGNLGIVSVRAQRAYDDPKKLNIFVGLQNSDVVERHADVELTIEGSVAAIKPVVLPGATQPGASAANTVAVTPAPAPAAGAGPSTPAAAEPKPESPLNPGVGGVVFTVEREDALLAEVRLRPPVGSAGDLDPFPTDDRVYVQAPPAKRLRVGIVTSGSLFLSSALAGLPLAELRTFTPAEYKKMAEKGESLPLDVVILDGVLPPLSNMSNAAGLPPGRFLVLGGVPAAAPAKEGPAPPLTDKGKAGNATIVDWQRTHPALRNVTLDSVFIAESRDVEVRPGSTAVTIARTERGPAIIELSSGPTRAIIVPFDISASSWPLDVSFVVFLASALDYLGGDAIAGASDFTQMGATVSERLPAGATDIRLLPPPGVEDLADTVLTPLPDGTVVFGPVRRAGVYRLTWKGGAAPGDLQENGRTIRRIPANLLDPQESVVAATPSVELASRVVTSKDGTFKGDQRLWPYLLLACAGLLMLEWFIYNRKVHI
ncbi:MAG: VWA domain-containing protein [Phycisphaeraceae bacterium]|nr:VWA domain-containing protein [Phycisphaeraceae bacterium]